MYGPLKLFLSRLLLVAYLNSISTNIGQWTIDHKSCTETHFLLWVEYVRAQFKLCLALCRPLFDQIMILYLPVWLSTDVRRVCCLKNVPQTIWHILFMYFLIFIFVIYIREFTVGNYFDRRLCQCIRFLISLGQEARPKLPLCRLLSNRGSIPLFKRMIWIFSFIAVRLDRVFENIMKFLFSEFLIMSRAILWLVAQLHKWMIRFAV